VGDTTFEVDVRLDSRQFTTLPLAEDLRARDLWSERRIATFRKVKLSSLLPIVAAALLLSGCQNSFTKFRVTNYRDELVAEWIARGYVVPLERGYGITAVERTSGPPYSMATHYPDGWRTTVAGPHIWHWHCPKPRWLAEYDGDIPTPTPRMESKHAGRYW